MNILIMNGSPKGKRSNTYMLTQAFVRGMQKQQTCHVEEVDICQLQIHHCLGCFSCWKKTPGVCCIKDDMAQLLEKRIKADIIIWSFPLYYFSIPGQLKNVIDRQLPMMQPKMVERADGFGNGSHPGRYDVSHQKHVVISTCGFYTAKGNYDGVISLFNHICGLKRYESIFCGQGELFHIDFCQDLTNRYLSYVQQAGQEYMQNGITDQTRKHLDELLLPKDVFEQMANAHW